MAEIDGGGLSFKSLMDNDQLNAAVDESLRRVQGLSDGTVAGGKAMDAAFISTANSIRNTLSDIGNAMAMHEQELERLESEYKELGETAGKAFSEGRDDEYKAITRQRNVVKGEIIVRENLVKELIEQSNKLENAARKIEENTKKSEENANTQQSMRSRIKELREEMMLLVDQGIDEQSEAYKRLTAELGRLTDIQGDVAQQGRMLANDEQQFQGIITGLSGLAGGFSAVTGAISLFRSENEDLQKVMTKVQSVMAITIGMQQVAQALNKDSAFQLVTLGGLKKWYAGITEKTNATLLAQTKESVAAKLSTDKLAESEARLAAASKLVEKQELTRGVASATAYKKLEIAQRGVVKAQVANTAAQAAQQTAATTATIANKGLAGSFRLIGTAIKSIPGFGWILAAISALGIAMSSLSSKMKKVKEEREKIDKATIEGSYKAIGSVESLSFQWNKLGTNLQEKERFIKKNSDAFKELSISIKSVEEAEKFFMENKDNFIKHLIAKAEALAIMDLVQEKIKERMTIEKETNAMPDTKTNYYSDGNAGVYLEVDNPEKVKNENKIKVLNKEIEELYRHLTKKTIEGDAFLKETGVFSEKERESLEEIKKQKEKGVIEIQDLQTSLMKTGLEKTLKQLEDEKNKKISAIDDEQKELEKKYKEAGKTFTKKDAAPFNERKNLVGKIYTKDVTEAKLKYNESLEDIKKQEEEGLLKINELKTSLMKDGLEKQLKQIEDGKNKKIESIDKEQKELKKKYEEAGKTFTKKDAAPFDERKKLTEKEYDKDVEKAKKGFHDAFQEFENSLTDIFLNSEALANKEIERKYIALKEKWKEILPDDKYSEIFITINNAEIQEKINRIAKEWKTFEEKRAEISDKYDSIIGALKLKKAKATVDSEIEYIESQIDRLEKKKNENEPKDFYKSIQSVIDGNTVSLKKYRVETEQLFAYLRNESDATPFDLPENYFKDMIGDIEILIKLKNALTNTEYSNSNKYEKLLKGINEVRNYLKKTKLAAEETDESLRKISINQAFDHLQGAIENLESGISVVNALLSETKEIISDLGDEDISKAVSVAENLISSFQSGGLIGLAIQGFLEMLKYSLSQLEKFWNDHIDSYGNKLQMMKDKYKDAFRDLEKDYKGAVGSDLGMLYGLYSILKREEVTELNTMIYNIKKEIAGLRNNKRDNKRKELLLKLLDTITIAYYDAVDAAAEYETAAADAIFGENIQTAIENFANAWANAWDAGEDRIMSSREIIKKMIRNVIMELIKADISGNIEAIRQKINDLFYNVDGVTEDTIFKMGDDLVSYLDEKYGAMLDKIDNHFGDSKMGSSIRGITENQAGAIEGYLNIVRINQTEGIEIMREQLMFLSNIAYNTKYIYEIYKFMRGSTMDIGSSYRATGRA